MPVEQLSEREEAITTIDRRAFLRRAVVGATSAAVSSQFEGVLEAGEKDVSKMSANELLRYLPDRIPVESEYGNFARVKKYEVPGAEYLIVVLRNIHKSVDLEEAGEKEKPLIQKIIDASDNEIGQVMCELNANYGFRYFGSEDFTYPEYKHRKKILRGLPTTELILNDLKEKARRSSLREDSRKAQLGQDAYNEFIAKLMHSAPFAGLLEMERGGNAVLIPTESEKAVKAKNEEIKKPVREWDSKIISDDREDACLLYTYKTLSYRKANRAAMAWGALHWDIDEKVGVPGRAAIWNQKKSKDKFSFALITLPSVYEYEEALKLARQLRDRKQEQ